MKSHTKWALAGAAVVAVSLVSLQQTGALWSSSTTLDGSTITAGVLDLSAGTTGDKSFDFDSFKKEGMNEGDFAQAPMRLINSGDVGLAYTLTDVTLQGDAVPLDLTVHAVTSESDCGAETDPVGDLLYDGPMAGATTTSLPRQVAPEAEAVMCFRATMGQGAQPDESATANLEFTAEVAR